MSNGEILHSVTEFDNQGYHDEADLGSLDYLVLIAMLLIFTGMNLNRSLPLSGSNSTEELSVDNERSLKPSNSMDKLWTILGSAGSIALPFINSFSLFCINGEIFASSANLSLMTIGLLLSIAIILPSGFYTLMAENNLKSISSYLNERFNTKYASLLVKTSSALRHVMTGSLTLYIVTVSLESIIGLPSMVVSISVVAAAIVCVCASRIHGGMEPSSATTLIWLVGLSTIISLITTTIQEGGMSSLLSKADEIGKLQTPRISLLPWIQNSIWGFICLGLVMGFHIYGHSRVAIGCSLKLTKKTFICSVVVSYLLIVMWILIGTWAGLCSSVTFSSEMNSVRPDGTLAMLVNLKMQSIKGFRGFYVASLFASSISGLTRRYNQLIGLLWETRKEFCKKESSNGEEASTSRKGTLEHTPPDVSEDLLKELKWRDGKNTFLTIFSFKLFVGIVIGAINVGLSWLFINSNHTGWQIWQIVIGILSGAIMAALVICLIFPCTSHMSIVIGLLIGWATPCCLAIGNSIITSNSIYQQSPSTINTLMETSKIEGIISEGFEDYPNIAPILPPYNFIGINNFDTGILKPTESAKQWIHPELRQKNSPSASSNNNWEGPTIFRVNYCYYGIVGLLFCSLFTIFCTAITSRCKLPPDVPNHLLLPIVRKARCLTSRPISGPNMEFPTSSALQETPI